MTKHDRWEDDEGFPPSQTRRYPGQWVRARTRVRSARTHVDLFFLADGETHHRRVGSLIWTGEDVALEDQRRQLEHVEHFLQASGLMNKVTLDNLDDAVQVLVGKRCVLVETVHFSRRGMPSFSERAEPEVPVVGEG